MKQAACPGFYDGKHLDACISLVKHTNDMDKEDSAK
mgnify:CR=1 FL=1|jgi:hypothetical protein